MKSTSYCRLPYVYIYITNIFFGLQFMFVENIYLILNRYECNFQLQILHFEKCSASFHAVQGCFSKKEYVQIEHAILQKIS